MEPNSHPIFSIHPSLDGFVLLDCNERNFSLMCGRDIQDALEEGINANRVSEKSPFLSPLVWVALIYVSDWEKEKSLIRKLLLSKIDCNYVGLCGFNLFHVYLVQSLVSDMGFQKLQWWVDKPMVDCNVFSLSLRDRPNITMLHPAELISQSISRGVGHKERAFQILSYLVSRGLSCHYTTDVIPSDNLYLKQRSKKQQPSKKKYYNIKKDGQPLPTPQMNCLEDIPSDQHMTFTSSTGLRFRFHGSYMDTILKTHRFPFTMETIHVDRIAEWNERFEKEWVPREEFVGIPFLCQDKYMNPDKTFLHLLNQWVSPLYPYSRIIMLSTFPLTEIMYQYMCMRMRSGMFHLKPFHRKCKTTWKNFFLWACYDSIHEFLFANQMEELVSQLEIFYAATKPFPEEFPDADTFLWKNSLQPSTYNVFSEEFDYTLHQTYHLFKKMHQFLNP